MPVMSVKVKVLRQNAPHTHDATELFAEVGPEEDWEDVERELRR